MEQKKLNFFPALKAFYPNWIGNAAYWAAASFIPLPSQCGYVTKQAKICIVIICHIACMLVHQPTTIWVTNLQRMSREEKKEPTT